MPITLTVITGLVALASVALSLRAPTVGSFFRGHSPAGQAPGILQLTLSQVTTWIFARSLMNAAILGYFYGYAGTLAYAAYYLSFLTGGAIIASLRFRHGFDSIQGFLAARFGHAGPIAYNIVVAIRLVSEIFANLLVIGLLFGADGSLAYVLSMFLVAVVTLAYSLAGGLHASIRTDAMQMGLLVFVLLILSAMALSQPDFDVAAMLGTSADASGPGWVLLAVALLQIWSYPMHDPVMMDRGFVADRRTTMHSFSHAAWVSIICIIAFGMLGVYAGMYQQTGDDFITTLTRLLGGEAIILLNIALIVSCMSTLDSTFSSASKLAAHDLGLVKPTVRNGRIAMALFLAAGLAMVYFGTKDLFAAVAVSGTASMFLTPVIIFSLWMGRTDVPVWSYLAAFATAVVAAAWYFAESAGHIALAEPLFGLTHKYSILLALSALTLLLGCSFFLMGIASGARRDRPTST